MGLQVQIWSRQKTQPKREMNQCVYICCSVGCGWSCARQNWKAGRERTTWLLCWRANHDFSTAFSCRTSSRQSTPFRALPIADDIFRKIVKSATLRFPRARLCITDGLLANVGLSIVQFLPCDARCLSVCLSHAGILSKWLNISSEVFHHRVATPF